jgi:hypothetical protein
MIRDDARSAQGARHLPSCLCRGGPTVRARRLPVFPCRAGQAQSASFRRVALPRRPLPGAFTLLGCTCPWQATSTGAYAALAVSLLVACPGLQRRSCHLAALANNAMVPTGTARGCMRRQLCRVRGCAALPTLLYAAPRWRRRQHIAKPLGGWNPDRSSPLGTSTAMVARFVGS